MTFIYQTRRAAQLLRAMALIGILLAVSACAETTPMAASDPNHSVPSSSPAIPEGDVVIERLTIDDSERAPESIQIPAGTQVTLLVSNQRDHVHSVTIDELDVGTGDIQPNETGWIAFTMPVEETDIEFSRSGTINGKLIPE